MALYYAKVPTANVKQRRQPRRPRRRQSAEPAGRSRSRRGSNRWRPKPAFQGKTTTEDPDVASVVYSAQIDFPSEGEYKIVALIKEKGG